MSQQSTPSSNEFGVKELLYLLLEHRWVVIATTVLGTIIGGAYVLGARPVYQVDAMVQVETKDPTKNAANPLGELATIFEATNPTETEIEIIKSRMILGQVIQKRNLDVLAEPGGVGFVRRLFKLPEPKITVDKFKVPASYLDKTFHLDFESDSVYSLWEQGSKAPIGLGKVGVTFGPNRTGIELFISSMTNVKAKSKFYLVKQGPLDAAQSLEKALTITEVGKKTGMIGITLTGHDPFAAAATLNDIAEAYVHQNVDRKSEDAEKTLDFLNEQLPGIKRTLEESEERLNEYRSKMGSVDLEAQGQQMLEQQVEVQQKLLDLEQQRKEAAKLFRPDHPNVRILDSIATVYKAQAGSQEKELRRLPLQQQETVRLMRDVQVNTQLYTNLLNNAEQLQVVKAGEIGNVRVVDPAIPSIKPIKPKKPLGLLAGFVLGFGLGVGITIILQQFRNGVADPKVLEEELGLVVYATIPHSESQRDLNAKAKRKEKGTHLLTIVEPKDLAIESFRSLRTTLHFSMLDAKNKVILFAGPCSNIGKSFVSTNFATTLALAGQKVLLLDADMRRGILHQQFGLERGKGLSDILSGMETLESVQRDSRIPGLNFLSTGTLPPNPSELLLNERFGKLLDNANERYDYVIVDSAPVLAVTDAVIVGKLAGTTLMVLRHGQHPLPEIDACVQRLEHAGVKLKGIIFNDLRTGPGTNPYKYGRAAYSYEYGST